MGLGYYVPEQAEAMFGATSGVGSKSEPEPDFPATAGLDFRVTAASVFSE